MYQVKRPIENSHIVREHDRRRFRELLAVSALGVPVGLFLLLFTWQNLEVIRLGRESTRLRRAEQQLQNSNKNLKIEIERLTALDSVEKKASALGFVRTEADRIVRIVPPAATRTRAAPAGGR
jgi:hypothetical protein